MRSAAPSSSQPDQSSTVTGSLPRRRPVGIRRPVAPRSLVQSRAGEAGELQREEIVRRAERGAAVGDHRPLAGAERLVSPPERLGRQEATVRAEIGGERGAQGTRDVAGARVDRLRLAAVPLAGASVEEQRWSTQHGGHRIRADKVVARSAGGPGGGLVNRRVGGERETGCRPGRDAAVEHSRTPVAAEVPVQPPQPRGDAAARIVVGDDHVLVADSPRAQDRGQLRWCRDGMPARSLARRGELAIGVDEDRARQVSGGEEIRAGRTRQRPADVGDPERGVEQVGLEPVDADDRPWQAQHGSDDRPRGAGRAVSRRRSHSGTALPSRSGPGSGTGQARQAERPRWPCSPRRRLRSAGTRGRRSTRCRSSCRPRWRCPRGAPTPGGRRPRRVSTAHGAVPRSPRSDPPPPGAARGPRWSPARHPRASRRASCAAAPRTRGRARRSGHRCRRTRSRCRPASARTRRTAPPPRARRSPRSGSARRGRCRARS